MLWPKAIYSSVSTVRLGLGPVPVRVKTCPGYG